jgi:hypothetical protein
MDIVYLVLAAVFFVITALLVHAFESLRGQP